MATFLSSVGRFAFRRRGLVTLLWLAALVGIGVAASSAPTPPADTFSMPGTESQKAFDLLKEKFPAANAEGATARVVLRAPQGHKLADPEERAKVEDLVGRLGRAPEVVAVSDPFKANAVSKDGTTAYAVATYKVAATKLDDKAHDALTGALDHSRKSGLTVEAGGDAVKLDAGSASGTEGIGILVSALVLILTFGSMIAAGMPLLTALIGVAIGTSAITALGSTLGLSSTTSTLAMMIGLAVGIDYALFVISRYRSELSEGRERQDAAARAVGTAGTAVVFAGLTVIIALAGLAVVNVPMLTKMGLTAAGTVAIAVLIAITFVPALLGFAPIKVMPRAERKRFYGKPLTARQQRKADKRAARQKPNLGTRWAAFVVRRPLVVLLVGVAGLGALAIPAAGMQLGLPSEGTYAKDTTQRKAYDLLSDSFGAGFNGPLTVTVQGKDTAAAAGRVGKRLAKVENVAMASPAATNPKGDTAIITVVPKTGPQDHATEELVRTIRGMKDDFRSSDNATVLVTGQTALYIDFSKTLDDALLPYLGLVVGLAFLLLMLVFRSVLVPLKAALGFLLSISAALGALVAVFQWGWLAKSLGIEQQGQIMSTLPIFMIGVVFGLAMDYEVFLVARMREAYVHGASPSDAVVTGFRYGGRIVTAAAVIMASVFSGFILDANDFVKMIGFGLAAAVLFDAFVVRMALVPALFALLGRSAWWLPRWLDRLLPDMDVEGEKLTRFPASAPIPGPRHEREPVHTG
ncbi:MMPL family transporter [Streptomyces sp. TLI_185]|uniref:MMPL family transporter n=1 Tax=Streptomyces sp. TLI_185 TaxID=2485151 RepID=UPI000F4FBB40|nr:MMPL family transporter [Streptomyces sp. TLI_185]RPF24812.1 RND superfamily putative drug exporter [Streptomyces sp. TLI_185]